MAGWTSGSRFIIYEYGWALGIMAGVLCLKQHETFFPFSRYQGDLRRPVMNKQYMFLTIIFNHMDCQHDDGVAGLNSVL